MTDMPRARQAHIVANPENKAQAENAVHKDICQTIHSLSMELNMSIGTMHAIKQDHGYHKMYSQHVPCLLINTQKKHRTLTLMEHLQQYHTQGDAFLRQIVAGNET